MPTRDDRPSYAALEKANADGHALEQKLLSVGPVVPPVNPGGQDDNHEGPSNQVPDFHGNPYDDWDRREAELDGPGDPDRPVLPPQDPPGNAGEQVGRGCDDLPAPDRDTQGPGA